LLHDVGGELNWSDEPITDFAYGLDDMWRARVVLEDAPEFGDAADKSVVSDIGIGPDGMNEFFLGEDFAVAGDQFDQDLHDFGFETNKVCASHHAVQLRLNLPVCNLEF